MKLIINNSYNEFILIPTKVVTILYEQGKIKEKDYKKYLLTTDIKYLPPLRNNNESTCNS